MSSLKKHLGIILILLLAFFVRLPLLSGSLWMDEAAQVLESERSFFEQTDIVQDFQPPLMHYLLHFALQLNASEAWLRLVGALLPGLITIWATYQIGKLLYSKNVGLLTSLLLSISSFHVFFSQELRPYSLPAMFALLSWLALLQFSRANYKKIISTPLVMFTVFTILGLYSGYLYPFLFFSQLVYLLIFSRRFVPHIAFTVIMSALAYLPWLPMFLRQLEAGGLVRAELPGWETAVSTPQLKSLPLTFGKFIYGVMDLELSAFFLVSLAVLIALGAALKFSRPFTNWVRFGKDNLALVVWLLLPFFTAWIVSFFVPVIQPKRLMFLLPPFLLVLSVFATDFWKDNVKSFFLKNVSASLLVVYIFISIVSLYSYWTKPELQRENWRSLQQEISMSFPPSQTVVVFSFPEAISAWRYYDRGNYPVYATGSLHIQDAPNLTARLQQLDRYEYLLVFDYLRDLTDPEDRLLWEIKELGYQETAVLNYPNIGFIRVYTKTGEFLASEII